MNKRIEELSEQAMNFAEAIHGRFHEGHEDPNWDTFIAYEKKFAELIVKECISFKDALSQFDSTTAYGDGYENGIKDMAELIEEHFGVE